MDLTKRPKKNSVLEQLELENPSFLTGRTEEELISLKTDIDLYINRRKQQSTVENIREDIRQAQRTFDAIEWGEDWKSEKTSDAVHKLSKIEISAIVNSIIYPSFHINVALRLAIEISNVTYSIIRSAAEYGNKKVNGSMGEWCPDTASEIDDLWLTLSEKIKNQNPDPEIVKEAKHLRHWESDFTELNMEEVFGFIASQSKETIDLTGNL